MAMIRTLLYAAVTVLLVGCIGIAVIWYGASLPAMEVPLTTDRTLVNVHVINPGKERLSHRTVTIEDGVVTSITPTDKKGRRQVPRFVLPGLIDAHVHAPRLEADEELFHTLFLMHGVTSVRNLGGDGRALELAEAIEKGARIGPRMFGCGTIFDGPQGNWVSEHFDDPEEAVEAVRAQHEAGAVCIKVYPMLPPKVFLALKDEAQKLGLPVVGRTNNRLGIEGAAMDEVQHLHGVLDVVSPGFRAQDVREWLKAWKKKFNKERVKLAIRMAKLHKSAHTPALVGVAYLAGGKNSDLPMPDSRLVPNWYESTIGTVYYARDKKTKKRARAALPRMMKTVKKLHAAGVPILAGTDTPVDGVIPGISLHDELRLLVSAGFTPEQALASATTTPGERFGIAGLGVVREGAPADVLVFSDDPTKSLDHLSSLDEVIVDGRTYTARSLTIHQRKQIKASRKGFYKFVNDLLPHQAELL